MVLDPETTSPDSRDTRRPARNLSKSGDAIDLGPLEALIGFQIHLLDLLMYQMYYERLGKAAMTPGMFSTLATIKANSGVRQGALADALLIRRPNMTLLINRLIRTGYVRRRAARGDNRGVELFLRADGERALNDVAATLAAHEHGLTASLTKAERERLGALLAKMVRHLRAAPRTHGRAAMARHSKAPTR
jgi:DNA-binding MarR family transcriptional regulator